MVSVPFKESVDAVNAPSGDQEEEAGDWYGDDVYQEMLAFLATEGENEVDAGGDDDEDNGESPVTAGLSPSDAVQDMQPLLCQDVEQYFAARGVRDVSRALHVPARLYVPDGDFLAGSVVTAGHMLGFFPENHDGNNDEQEPLMVNLHDITDIVLTVPEGLVLTIPPSVRFDTLLNNPLLGVTMFLAAAANLSLLLDVPTGDDAGQERERVRWFINGLLARFEDIRGI